MEGTARCLTQDEELKNHSKEHLGGEAGRQDSWKEHEA